MGATTTGRQREATDLFYRLEGRFTEIVAFGEAPDGVRMDGHYSCAVTAGELPRSEMTGVDYYRIRSDGVGVVDAREVMTIEGARVSVLVRGYVLPPEGFPVPSSRELAAPDFAWPDVAFAIEAFAWFETGAAALAELNRTVVTHTGTVNLGAGTLFVEARRLTRP